MTAQTEDKPMTPDERHLLGLRTYIKFIESTMPALYNNRQRRQIKKLEKAIKEIESRQK